MNSLTNQIIKIVIDSEKETYSVDMNYCEVDKLYLTLKAIISSLEDGTFFEDQLEISDNDGKKLDKDRAKAIVNILRKQIKDTQKKSSTPLD